MSVKDKSELKAAIRYMLDAAIEIDRREPAGDIQESELPPCACGFRLNRSNAGTMRDLIDEKIHLAIEPLIPERCRWFVRSALNHLYDCQLQ